MTSAKTEHGGDSMEWAEKAACKGAEELFTRTIEGDQEYVARARDICVGCPVRDRCLYDAMTISRWEMLGVCGGTTEWERRQIKHAIDHDPEWMAELETLSQELTVAEQLELRKWFETTGPSEEEMEGMTTDATVLRFGVVPSLASLWATGRAKRADAIHNPTRVAILAELQDGDWHLRNDVREVARAAVTEETAKLKTEQLNRRRNGKLYNPHSAAGWLVAAMFDSLISQDRIEQQIDSAGVRWVRVLEKERQTERPTVAA